MRLRVLVGLEAVLLLQLRERSVPRSLFGGKTVVCLATRSYFLDSLRSFTEPASAAPKKGFLLVIKLSETAQ